MTFTDSSSNWIWAYKSGSAVSSDSVSASVSQHTEYDSTTLNLQNAVGGSSSNPPVQPHPHPHPAALQIHHRVDLVVEEVYRAI
jgi:hypothetical protein